jgi:peptidoglycan/LPS O-acetylase OafA/YrhL
MAGLYLLWLAGAWLAEHWDAMQRRSSLPLLCASAVWVLLLWALNGRLYGLKAKTWLIMLTDYAALPGFLGMIVCGHHLAISSSPWLTRLCVWLGTLSYPCYLLHEPLMTFLRRSSSLERASTLWNVLLPASVALLIAGTLGVAAERSFMIWRAKLMKRRIAQPALA